MTIKFDGFDAYQMDENLESGEGVRVEYDDGRAFILHRAGGSNRKYSRLLLARTKPHQRKIDIGALPDAIGDRIMRECYADAIIVGWDGITSGGNPVPFTRENVLAFLEQEPEVFRAIQRDAADLSIFRREQQDDDEGNSGASSAGK